VATQGQVEEADYAEALREAVRAYAEDKSAVGRQRATALLLQVLNSTDVDLLLDTCAALSNDIGFFIDAKLAHRFLIRAVDLSYKGNYYRGALLFSHNKKLARAQLAISAKHGHFASRILRFVSYKPGNKILEVLLFKPILTIYLRVLVVGGLRRANPEDVFWRYRDVVNVPIPLIDNRIKTDRKNYLAGIKELTPSRRHPAISRAG
jgi:hypothetical protein